MTTTDAMEFALKQYAKEPLFGYNPTQAMVAIAVTFTNSAEWLRGIALAAQMQSDTRRRLLDLRREAA